MAHQLGVSGSTILSNSEHLHDLFLDGLDHIEIGEFCDENSFQQFLDIVNKDPRSFGIHSPLKRKNSKYDLLEFVHMEPREAWAQVEEEAKRLSSLGAEYILIHFPYFKHERMGDIDTEIERGLEKLSKLQDTYKIPFVCEPKLGQNRNPCGIHYLNNFSVERWGQYDLPLCFDVGDYLLADPNHIFAHIHKWLKHITVVHLHNVSFEGEKYIWAPVHPSQENDSNFYSLKPIIQELAQGSDMRFIFEHTPHHVPSRTYVQEGIHWVHSLIR